MGLQNLWYLFFQKDYWGLQDSELELIAKQHNISPLSRAGEEGQHWYVDRERIIATLIGRDSALRTRITTALSILALVISVISLIISIRKN